MNSYPKLPRAWWPRIAEEYAAGMSGPKLAKKYGVGSTRTIYLILEKYRREQTQQSLQTKTVLTRTDGLRVFRLARLSICPLTFALSVASVLSVLSVFFRAQFAGHPSADVRRSRPSRGVCRQFCRQTPGLHSSHPSAIHRSSADSGRKTSSSSGCSQSWGSTALRVATLQRPPRWDSSGIVSREGFAEAARP